MLIKLCFLCNCLIIFNNIAGELSQFHRNLPLRQNVNFNSQSHHSSSGHTDGSTRISRSSHDGFWEHHQDLDQGALNSAESRLSVPPPPPPSSPQTKRLSSTASRSSISADNAESSRVSLTQSSFPPNFATVTPGSDTALKQGIVPTHLPSTQHSHTPTAKCLISVASERGESNDKKNGIQATLVNISEPIQSSISKADRAVSSMSFVEANPPMIYKAASTHTIRTRPPSKSRVNSTSQMLSVEGVDTIADGIISTVTNEREISRPDHSKSAISKDKNWLDGGSTDNNAEIASPSIPVTSIMKSDSSDIANVTDIKNADTGISILLPEKLAKTGDDRKESTPRRESTPVFPSTVASGGTKRPRLGWGQGLRTPTATQSAGLPSMVRSVSHGAGKDEKQQLITCDAVSSTSSLPGMSRSRSDMTGLHSVDSLKKLQANSEKPDVVLDKETEVKVQAVGVEEDKNVASLNKSAMSCPQRKCGNRPDSSCVVSGNSISQPLMEEYKGNGSTTKMDCVHDGDKTSTRKILNVKLKGKPGRPSLTDEEKALKRAERKALKKKLAGIVSSTAVIEQDQQGGCFRQLEGGFTAAASSQENLSHEQGENVPTKKKRGRPAGKGNADPIKSPKKTSPSTTVRKSLKSPRSDKDMVSDTSVCEQQLHSVRKATQTEIPVATIDDSCNVSSESKPRENDKESKRGGKSRTRKRGVGDIEGEVVGNSTSKHIKRGKGKGVNLSPDGAHYGGIPRLRRSRSELRQSASIGEIFTSLTDIRKAYFAVQNVLRLQVHISGLDQEGLDNLNKKISNPYSVVTLPIPPTSEIATCLDIIELHSHRLNDSLLELGEFQLEFQQRSRIAEKLKSSDRRGKKVNTGYSKAESANQQNSASIQRKVGSSRLSTGLSINIPRSVEDGGNPANMTNQLSTVHMSSPITILKKHRNNTASRLGTGSMEATSSNSRKEELAFKARDTAVVGNTQLEKYKSTLFLSAEEYIPLMQSNFAKAKKGRVMHAMAPVSAAVQDPRFTDHQLSFHRKDLEQKRPHVIKEIRRRKLKTIQAWEVLGDRYLNINHNWSNFIKYCGPKEEETKSLERQGPRLRAVSAINSSSTSNLSGLSSANGGQSVDVSGRNSDIGGRFSSLRATSDLVRHENDQEKVLQHQAMVALMKRRLEYGTSDIPSMLTPWVQADNTVLPVVPTWPPPGLKVPEYYSNTIASAESTVSPPLLAPLITSSPATSRDVSFEKKVEVKDDDGQSRPLDVSTLLLPPVPRTELSCISQSNMAKKNDNLSNLTHRETSAALPVELPIEKQTSVGTCGGIVEINGEGNVAASTVIDDTLNSHDLQEESFPQYVASFPAVVDLNGCRLTLDGQRQRCSQIPTGVPCPAGCNCAKQVDKLERVSRVWTDMEKCIFVDKFMQYPKNFHKISSFLVNRTTRECIQFYYDSKAVIPYKSLLREFDNRKRGVKNNWSHTCQAALSMGSVIYPPIQLSQLQVDDKEPHCELPVETAYTAHANHPPYMALAKDLESVEHYGNFRQSTEDSLVNRPPRPLTDFLVARRRWKKRADTQSSAIMEVLHKAKKNTLIVGDSVCQSKVPQKWVYLQDDECNVESGPIHQQSSEKVMQQQAYIVKTEGHTLTNRHPTVIVPNLSEAQSNNYLANTKSFVIGKKKSKKDVGEMCTVYGGYGLGSEYLACAPIPTSFANSSNNISTLEQQSGAVEKAEGIVKKIHWNEIYPLDCLPSLHTEHQICHPGRSRYPIAKLITKRMATGAKPGGRRTSGGVGGRSKPKLSGSNKGRGKLTCGGPEDYAVVDFDKNKSRRQPLSSHIAIEKEAAVESQLEPPEIANNVNNSSKSTVNYDDVVEQVVLEVLQRVEGDKLVLETVEAAICESKSHVLPCTESGVSENFDSEEPNLTLKGESTARADESPSTIMSSPDIKSEVNKPDCLYETDKDSDVPRKKARLSTGNSDDMYLNSNSAASGMNVVDDIEEVTGNWNNDKEEDDVTGVISCKKRKACDTDLDHPPAVFDGIGGCVGSKQSMGPHE